MKTILLISAIAIVFLTATYSDIEQSDLLARRTKLVADPALKRQDRSTKRRSNKRRGKKGSKKGRRSQRKKMRKLNKKVISRQKYSGEGKKNNKGSYRMKRLKNKFKDDRMENKGRRKGKKVKNQKRKDGKNKEENNRNKEDKNKKEEGKNKKEKDKKNKNERDRNEKNKNSNGKGSNKKDENYENKTEKKKNHKEKDRKIKNRKVQERRKSVKGKSRNEKRIKDRRNVTCSSSDLENYATKAVQMKNVLKNLIRVGKLVRGKYQNVENSTSMASFRFLAMSKILGKVTENGTDCRGSCIQDACDKYTLLKECPSTAKAACSMSYNYNSDTGNRDTCLATLNNIINTCSSNKTGKCCGNWTELQNLDYSCNYTSIFEDTKAVRKTCVIDMTNGSYKLCMSYIKDSGDLIDGCWSNAEQCSSTSTLSSNTDSLSSSDDPTTQTSSSSTGATTSGTGTTPSEITTAQTTPVVTMTPTSCPSTSTAAPPQPPTVSTCTDTFVDDGAVFTHRTTYDQVNNEAVIEVSSSLDRVPVTIVVNSNQMVTATNNYCLVENTPADVTNSLGSYRQRQCQSGIGQGINHCFCTLK